MIRRDHSDPDTLTRGQWAELTAHSPVPPPERQRTTPPLLPERPVWQAAANCRGLDPDLFYPEQGVSTREAEAVCAGCVVREDCLEYALANGERFGVWGGTSAKRRLLVRRARRQAAA